MNIKESIDLLKEGGTLLYPSDTIWGLGCDATNDEACQKILTIKDRPAQKSFIILVDGFPMLERYVPEFHEVCYDIADFAEKPLTIIYPNVKGIAPTVLAEDGSVGIRITTDANCLKLIRGMRKPLVSTSANISGERNPTNFDEISSPIKESVDGILEERLTEKMVKPSQIIKIDLDGTVKIIRK
ncbi:MAG: L-threonylcarbamoyladenylate synthase [Crocinitomicaceae bacterium]